MFTLNFFTSFWIANIILYLKEIIHFIMVLNLHGSALKDYSTPNHVFCHSL